MEPPKAKRKRKGERAESKKAKAKMAEAEAVPKAGRAVTAPFITRERALTAT